MRPEARCAHEESASARGMRLLAVSFPTLSQAEGTRPWNPERLDAWAAGPVPGSGARYAARFVLAVWNGSGSWKCGRFDVVDAFAAWDRAHREAFLAWAAKPWWP